MRGSQREDQGSRDQNHVLATADSPIVPDETALALQSLWTRGVESMVLIAKTDMTPCDA